MSRFESLPVCSVDGCQERATRVKAGLCEACYCRKRRTGSTAKRVPTYQWKTGKYVKTKVDSHPLADNGGVVYVHRLVVYELHDGVCQPCHWCGVSLEWGTAVVDHLNENKQDNREENLVVSCNNCNRARGAMLPFLLGMRPEVREQFLSVVGDCWESRKTTTEDGGFGNG
jgi:5-methylcytosine-specific restriction endonuclease McrA